MPSEPHKSSPNPENNTADSKSVDPEVAAYNFIVDTVGGVNARRSDNTFQLVFVAVSIFLGALIGALITLMAKSGDLPWYGGAMIGGFLGMVLGVIASGTYLLIYRLSRHLKGKHD